MSTTVRRRGAGINRLTLLFHTVRYLRPSQIFGRLWFRLNRPTANLSPAPELRKNAKWTEPVAKSVCLITPWQFSFLNEEHQCQFPADWNNPYLEKLWLYNLHYFDDLTCHGAGGRKEWHEKYIQQWINDNSPGHGNGWEPYPLSLRIVNWIKWALAGGLTGDEFLHSLAVQTRFLHKRLEYHLLGNHLFANGKALVFTGFFFTGEEADRWRVKGLEIIEQEVKEQVLNDGGHFERSPMYHSIILEDLLDLINIMQAFGLEIPARWLSVAEKMNGWLQGMSHPDGDIVLFNDAALDIASRPEELFAYGKRLGLQVGGLDKVGLNHFHETGYISWHQVDIAAWLDVAAIGPDYLPGHAHADTLSFELSLFDKRVIIDSGTSCYGTSPERLRQRGTAAHNSVTVDGENSSEVWSGFRVARRAKPFGLEVIEDDKSARIYCCHDGYQRLLGRPTHCREWRFSERKVLITDKITGEFNEAVARVHLHPDVMVSVDKEGKSGTLTINEEEQVQWKVKGGGVTLVPSTYHPGFGVSLSGQCMEILFDKSECSFQVWW